MNQADFYSYLQIPVILTEVGLSFRRDGGWNIMGHMVLFVKNIKVFLNVYNITQIWSKYEHISQQTESQLNFFILIAILVNENWHTIIENQTKREFETRL